MGCVREMADALREGHTLLKTGLRTQVSRNLCYRKDDRAMRPIHGFPENFRDSLTTPTTTIPNIFYGLLFGSTL